MRDGPPSFHSDSRETPGPREPSFKISTAHLLVILGFVTIGILFAATLVAYVVTRNNVKIWHPDSSGLPPGLFVSTGLLVCVSLGMEHASNSIAHNRHESLLRGLYFGLASAIAFLLVQASNWFTVIHAQALLPHPTLFAFTFYLLTGLHAAHVLGGFVPLGIVLHNASEREYSSSRFDGVRFCVWYWHYLGIIWLVLLTVMYLAD
jgi:cytochrome c oxidase subunit 3